MKKANTQDTEVPAGTVITNDSYITAIKDWMVYPINLDERRARRAYRQIESDATYWQNSIEDLRRAMTETEESLRLAHEELAKTPKPPDAPVGTPEMVTEELEAVARLPWVLQVEMVNSTQISIKTRPGVLKTTLETRYVDVGNGGYELEYQPEPVTVAMPQYELLITLTKMGEHTFANNTAALAIRLINETDISSFVAGRIFGFHSSAHWAAGSGGFANWSGLCFGEYQEDLHEASIKGLVPFLTELASYLQTAGDGHAYRPKPQWAATLGKPGYEEYVYRVAQPGETREVLRERYKRDFKIMNPVEVKEGATVNPGASTPTQDGGALTATRLNEAMAMLNHPMPYDIIAEDDDDEDDCDCYLCDEECECECHE